VYKFIYLLTYKVLLEGQYCTEQNRTLYVLDVTIDISHLTD